MATKSTQTFERPHRPLAVRLYNLVGRQLERCGLRPNRLTEESILEAARRRANLTDFGDEGFRVPLRRLLQSCQEDARLNPFGRLLMRRNFVESAVNRLKIHDDLTRHPEILDAPIRRPLFVTGLPRTGTTLLQNLLSLDPASRPLLTWEAFWPSPPPEAETRRTDPRIKQARAFVKMLYRLAPQLRAVHTLRPEGPSECLSLMYNTFVSPAFLMLADLAGYEEWLWALDREARMAVYEDYRRQLQLLQWRCPADHWVLKQPAHLAAVDALLSVFPDGCIVQTHRDPAKAVPSLCSLFAIMRGMASDDVDPGALGPRAAKICAELVDRATAAREVAPDRVFDVQYAALVRDPIATVHHIYERFGYQRSDQMDANMQRWLTDNARDRSPSHQYDLAQFGLDPPTIDSLFGAYCERFEVPRESIAS